MLNKTLLSLLLINGWILCMETFDNIQQIIATMAIEYTKQERSQTWSVEAYNNTYGTGLDHSKYLTYSSLFDTEDNFTLVSKEGVKPSVALKDIEENLTLFDCGCFISFIYHKALLAVVGQEVFDHAVPQIRLSGAGTGDKKSTMAHYTVFTVLASGRCNGCKGNRPLNIRDSCHFSGIRHYACKHPAGYAGGYNVIYVGDNQQEEQLFIGLSFQNPLTEREIYLLMLEAYNKDRSEQDLSYIDFICNNKDIKLRQQAESCNKELNNFLKDHWIISKDEFDKHSKEFNAGSQRSFCSEKIRPLKNLKQLLSILRKPNASNTTPF